jgi:hypothetical protein
VIADRHYPSHGFEALLVWSTTVQVTSCYRPTIQFDQLWRGRLFRSRFHIFHHSYCCTKELDVKQVLRIY